MNPLEKQFHIQQARLRTRKPAATLRGRSVPDAPAFSAEVLCLTDRNISNFERRQAWEKKMFQRQVAKLDRTRLSACRAKGARRIARNRINEQRERGMSTKQNRTERLLDDIRRMAQVINQTGADEVTVNVTGQRVDISIGRQYRTGFHLEHHRADFMLLVVRDRLGDLLLDGPEGRECAA